MSAAVAIHPGFPDVERVREDCRIRHNGTAGLWLGGRRLARARRESLRRMIREELQEASALRR
jgi:hypothetical protein